MSVEHLVRKIRGKGSRLLAEASLLSGLNLNKPASVTAKMTMRCNSRCRHCDIWQIDYAEREMSTAQWLEALERLRGWLGEFPMVFTGGEALLRPDLVEILEHAVSLGIQVELLTNGLDVDNELAGKIVASGIAQVTLSYDGATPATHDSFRGESGFHARTARAIAALARHREQSGRPLAILLKTVINRGNLPELAEIGAFARAGGFRLRYQPIEENYAAAPDPRWYQKSDLWIHDIPQLHAQISRLKELQAAGALIDNRPSELDSFVRYFENPEQLMAEVQAHEVGRSGKACLSSVSSFVISGNGDVRLCHQMAPIGNLTLRGPQQIWSQRKRCRIDTCGY